MAGATHAPHEHCKPAQWYPPMRAEHLRDRVAMAKLRTRRESQKGLGTFGRPALGRCVIRRELEWKV